MKVTKKMLRLHRILEIARNNAKEGLDQGQIESYEDNMRETIAGLYPDWTQDECYAAEQEFKKIVEKK